MNVKKAMQELTVFPEQPIKAVKAKGMVVIPKEELDKLEEARKELFDILEGFNVPLHFTSNVTGVMYNLTHRNWEEVKR